MAKPRHPDFGDEDRRLFREAVGPVRPLRRERVVIAAARPSPQPTQADLDEARVASELLAGTLDPEELEIGEELRYLKPGVAPRLLERLKRGQYSIADEIDLHQMSASVARAALKVFLDDSRRADRLCVKIIHGKGLRSGAAGPVLKRLVDEVLRRRDDVLAFASAKPAAGGTGATLVLLRRR